MTPINKDIGELALYKNALPDFYRDLSGIEGVSVNVVKSPNISIKPEAMIPTLEEGVEVIFSILYNSNLVSMVHFRPESQQYFATIREKPNESFPKRVYTSIEECLKQFPEKYQLEQQSLNEE